MNTLDNATQQSICEITEQNAQQLLIAESQNRVVIASFWSEASPDSQQINQVLESLAREYGGKFLLAKINTDQQPMIAAQLRIQQVPTVMVIKDQAPVDGFAGYQDEARIRDFLAQFLPSPFDDSLLEAQQLIAQQKFNEAIQLLRPIFRDSGERCDIGFALAHALMEIHRLDEVEEILSSVPMAEQNAVYEQLKAQLELKKSAGKSPEIKTLEDKLASNPDDLDTRMKLAIQYHEHHHSEDALEQLLQILKQDREFNNGEAKRTMLDIFKSLGNQDPLVAKYQKQLFSLMY